MHHHNSANVDPAELEKFNRIADQWWDPEGDFGPLHAINPLRLNWIESKALLAEQMTLDVGCGGGILSEGMAQRGAQVTGIDMAEESLAVARAHSEDSGWQVTYQTTTAEAWSEQHAQQYDIVTCLEMLEHVPNPASIVHACAQLVKPGGHVFFSTINRNLKSFLFAIVGAEHVLKLLPKGTHHYDQFIKPSELAQWSREADLVEQDIIGLTYNPLTRHYALKQDVRVNYLMHFIKPDHSS